MSFEHDLGDHLRGHDLEPEAGYVAHAMADESGQAMALLDIIPNATLQEVMLANAHDVSGVIVKRGAERQPVEIWATTHHAPQDDGSAEYCLVYSEGERPPMDALTALRGYAQHGPRTWNPPTQGQARQLLAMIDKANP